MEIRDERTSDEFTIVFDGDLSASRRSVGYRIGNARSLSFEVTWQSTGAPVGTFNLEVLNNPAQSNGEPHEAFALESTIAAQPNGAAGRMLVDNIHTSAAFVCASYTRTSGGDGANPVITVAIKRG